MRDIRVDLQRRIGEVLLPLLSGRDDRIHLIDPPNHPNVGDCAILLGELHFLARERPASRLRFHDFHTYGAAADPAILDSSVLLIHGGGNFGDIWPHHHQFRLHILRRFRDRPIIQLPQSIHFSSPDALKETQEAIAQHPDFTLLARDSRSEAFARANFRCEVQLCPDMAFGMEPITRRAPRADAFCLLRTDKEVVASHQEILTALREAGLSVEAADWLRDPLTTARLLDRGYAFFTKAVRPAYDAIATGALAARRRYAEQRLDVGIEMLSRGRTVVTDRLHAHIMSTLLGIPNIVFRSLDAKAAALFDTWTHASPLARLADRPADLAALTGELLDRR